MTTTGGLALDAAPRPSALRRTMRALAAIALVGVAVPVAARLLGWEPGPVAILVALMPWVTLAAAVPLVLAALARAWWLLAASAVVASSCVVWMVPLYVGAPAPPAGEEFTVASVSMTFGGADATEVVQLVRDHQVDVLALQELTPEAAVALRSAGLDAELPHSRAYPEPGFTGTGVWSRLGISDGRAIEGTTSRTVQVVVDAESGPLTVLAPHPAAPGLFAHSAWSADLAALEASVAGIDGPLLVLGDLNMTRDHRAFRDLESAGLADAATQAGAGFSPTFPQGRRPFPIAAIDHALVRDAPLTAVQVSTAAVSGADHRALVVTYVTP
ncbi:endonuclease/exonuclease/phosphatase family protein [Demequina muriae]|uniref:Endonuclease/exonuclease/phosphatase family protein n=1 Tax=Demequina muriae TaxID=3051664 RepID=A0ABT8GHR2_9MICO|nr:endonuclease/exonuclease/phosphatase family protein [Demequina sp. EGI L300058]MDN4480799.1 endonuclease/exonuclease/phosphatase family protein [Demequina sp. EGI L300058]